MISPIQLRDLVIVPTLQRLAVWNPKMHSPAAVNLLLLTQGHESLGGYYLKQWPQGPALSILQIEPPTIADLVRYMRDKQLLSGIVKDLTMPCMSYEDQLPGNLHLAFALARIKYWMSPRPLPDKSDIAGMAAYWDDIYNCNGKHYSQDGFLDNVKHVLSAML